MLAERGAYAGKPHGGHGFVGVDTSNAHLLSRLSPHHGVSGTSAPWGAGLAVCVSRVVDHVDRRARRQVQGKDLRGHPSFEHPLLARAVQPGGHPAPNLRESAPGAFKKNLLRAWNRCRIHLSNFFHQTTCDNVVSADKMM